MIARDLSRTREELLESTSGRALDLWKVLYAVEAEERADMVEEETEAFGA
jgi:hypothetical protein